MTLPPWAGALLPLLPDAGWLVLYRSHVGPIAARIADPSHAGVPLRLPEAQQAALRARLRPGARAVACRAAFLLHDDQGLQAVDGAIGAALPDAVPEAAMPDLFRRPEAALALPRGVWTLETDRLSAHDRLLLADALGGAPPRVEGGWILRVRAGVVLGRADPRLLPEAVARA